MRSEVYRSLGFVGIWFGFVFLLEEASFFLIVCTAFLSAYCLAMADAGRAR